MKTSKSGASHFFDSLSAGRVFCRRFSAPALGLCSLAVPNGRCAPPRKRLPSTPLPRPSGGKLPGCRWGRRRTLRRRSVGRRLSMARKVGGKLQRPGGAAGAQSAHKAGGGALSGPAPTLVWLARGPKAPGPPNAAAPPGRWSFCRRQKAGKSPAPRSMGPGARNAVRKGRGNGFAPRAKPGPMAYGPGRWKPPAAGYLPQGVRSRCCAPTNLRAAPPPAQGQPARSTAMRAAPKGLARCGR